MADETGLCGIQVCLESPKNYFLTSFLFELKFETDAV